MIRKRSDGGVLFLVGAFFLMFTALACNYFRIAFEGRYVRAAEQRSELTISAGESQGTVYDCNMVPIVNAGKKYYAVAVPYAIDPDKTAGYAVNREEFLGAVSKGSPFVFQCRENTPESEGLTVFSIPERYADEQSACHLIGYLSDGKGVSGIEYAYDRILRGDSSENTVTYSTDGFGRVLIGDGKTVRRSTADKCGVVTTIDSEIQKICEESGSDIEKGAIVVTDIYSGDILGMCSFPGFDPDNIDEALSSADSPLINRTLYSYGVGSIFKLVTSCEAINEGMTGFIHVCRGYINVIDQRFNCHKYDGHGTENMTTALTDSCNTYFIALSQKLDTKSFRRLAHDLGYGRETLLCAGMTGSAGVLPTVKDLDIPAELANFSFGQGKLSATPLQVNQMTCAIANGGSVPSLRVIRGVTADGETIANEKPPQLSKVIDDDTAAGLRRMMTAAVRDNSSSNARSLIVSTGAKTSTAQTGRYDEEGNEYCHAWITGFFPAASPKYAVTVLAEDGGYGNDAAAPVFRSIAEGITVLDKKRSAG